ncbi:MAG: hypothetical protein A3B16_02450 [Candidatus Zambryskibacteria bacterium RIFCSPLOWO2_01_FULL_45_43]|uniref:Dihydrofolate reductase n=2 Tax=Parcubacteria group TaxID=1794811 RepID=A0A1G1ZTJ4_9BACT|nr:MAG: hypothetical protein A3H63_01730 [Candidatus Harrisonbacteria bacterium RIFCSPLOWO2_02_FULL_45_10c]OHB04937.1 MAG: hypothetical protein A3B16_02450 [Candidatus Zambryskibacteria bacterium RIFCSPLOWO2_01_FULL_45_43]
MINIIVAMDENRVIGKRGRIPWHISDDIKRFKRLTMGHPVIMGRKTFESICSNLGKPLPGRTNVVVTRSHKYDAKPGCVIFHSLEKALLFVEHQQAFVIGGGEIYKQCLDRADRLYVTHVRDSFNGDTYFPKVDSQRWKLIEHEEHPKKHPKVKIPYAFATYARVF